MGLLTRDKPTRAARALTAGASRVTTANAEAIKRANAPWQETALAYYTQVGELWYASQFYSQSLAKLELTANEKDPKGGWALTKNPDVQACLDRIQDPGGGRSQMLGAYGRLMFLVGEAFLLGSIGPYGEQWEMLSPVELRVATDKTFERRFRASDNAPTIIRVPDPDTEPAVGDGQAYRLWRPSPTYSGDCDSPVRAILELCEELLLLQRAVRARARNRLAGNGILFIPDGLSFTPVEAVPDEDPEEDEFMARLIEAMVAPIEDEGSANAVVPLVLRGAAEDGKAILHIKTHDPNATYPETGLRKEAIERIALGLDIPPEVLLGMANANHWTAWQIDEQTWKAHLQPIAQHLVDELTAAYFRPALDLLGIENPEDYSIGYNASAIINRPDRGKDAEDAHAVIAISDEAYRAAKGFDEGDKPPEFEYRRRAGLLVKDGGLAVTGIPTLRPEKGEISPAQSDAGVPTGGGPGVSPAPGSPGLPAAPGAPAGGENPGAPQQEAQTASGGLVVDGAAMAAAMGAAVLRCKEIAGSRVRSKVSGDTNLAHVIHDVPNRLVAAHLGKETVEGNLALAGRAIVRGGTECFVAQLESWGVSPDVARQMAARVENEAVESLFVIDGPVPVRG